MLICSMNSDGSSLRIRDPPDRRNASGDSSFIIHHASCCASTSTFTSHFLLSSYNTASHNDHLTMIGAATVQLTVLIATCLLVASDAFVTMPAFAGSSRNSKLLATKSTDSLAVDDGLTTSAELIPRKVLFGNPEYASPMLSPDGLYLAYLAPSPDLGVLNVFVRKVTEDASKARMVTTDTSRGIRRAFWAEDSVTMLYMQDFEGDENFHLWAIDVTDDAAEARDLTPGGNVKAQNVITNKRYPNELLVATNARDPKAFDMYRCAYQTGELVMDTKNPGNVVGWGAEDVSFEVRDAVVRNQEDSSTMVRVRDDTNSEWRDLITFPFEEDGNLVDFCLDGKSCWMKSSIGRETTALLKVDLKTGDTLEEKSYDDKCDCGGVFLDQGRSSMLMPSFEG